MTCDLLLLGQKLVLRNDSPRTQKSPKSSAPSEAWLIRCCSRAFRTCLITPSHSRVVSMKLCSRVVSMKLSFRLPSPSTDLRKSSSQVDLDYSSPIRSRKQERALSSSSSIELGGGGRNPTITMEHNPGNQRMHAGKLQSKAHLGLRSRIWL